MDMQYFSPVLGLVTDNDPTSENGQVFLTDYAFLLHQRGYAIEEVMVFDIFKTQLDKSKTNTEGLYHRNALLQTRTISHDNLSAIFAYSYFKKTNHRFDIWKYLIKYLGTYDNTQGKSTQFSRHLPFNPSNFFIWGLCAESKLAYLFLPFFLINLLITLTKHRENTSGKILLDIELYALREITIIRLLRKYYTYKMKKQYGENYQREIRQIYHGKNSREFPINKILGIYYKSS